MFIFFIIFAFSFLGFIIHFNLRDYPRTPFRIIKLLLLYQLVFNVGILGFLAFFGLTFMAHTVASYNGWPASPFQQEMANVNLAFGIVGILCIWFRGHFWTATVIAVSIWLFGDGINHLIDALISKNYSEGNTGILLYTDLGIPLILMTLLFFYLRLRKCDS